MIARSVPLTSLLILLIGVVSARAQSTISRSETETRTETAMPRWELSLGGQVGVPKGFVKVGELDRAGNKLRLNDDLGIDTFEVADLGLAYHITPRDTLRGQLSSTFLYGSATFGEPVAYNGALLASGAEIRSRPIFVRATALYEHEFVHTDRGATFAFGGGVSFAYLDFRLRGALAQGTIGHETKEDFYAQELPIPLLSMRAEYPIAPQVSLLGTINGGFLPKVSSLRSEGGTVKLAQGEADVFAGVRYAITPRLLADGGYSYTYFSQHETSGEDNNKILFIGHAFGFAMTYLF